MTVTQWALIVGIVFTSFATGWCAVYALTFPPTRWMSIPSAFITFCTLIVNIIIFVAIMK